MLAESGMFVMNPIKNVFLSKLMKCIFENASSKLKYVLYLFIKIEKNSQKQFFFHKMGT